MAKIYIVYANNLEDYEDYMIWNVAAFNSEEAAREFIPKFADEIMAARSRCDELDEIEDERGLTEEEREEVARLCNLKWDYKYLNVGNVNDVFGIEELDILG